MELQYRPFLAQSSHQNMPTLIWALDESHARELFLQQRNVAENDVVITQLFDILVPDEMLRVVVPENFKGSYVETGSRKNPKFLVPNFLSKSRTAVIYNRVSTRRQVKNTSLGSQRQDCEEFAAAANLAVVQAYSEAESGNYMITGHYSKMR